MDCQKCSEDVKAIRGCEQEVEPYIIEGEQYTRCPIKLITRETRGILNLYSNVKNYGVLPNTGGLLDQGCKVIELMNIIDITMSKRRKSNV